jgi:hypothetical protein
MYETLEDALRVGDLVSSPVRLEAGVEEGVLGRAANREDGNSNSEVRFTMTVLGPDNEMTEELLDGVSLGAGEARPLGLMGLVWISDDCESVERPLLEEELSLDSW